MADKLIHLLKIIGTISGGYIGYKYGTQIKDKVYNLNPKIKENVVLFLKDTDIPEDTFFKSSTGMFGIGVGYSLWYVSIPIGTVMVLKDYPNLKNWRK